MKFLTKYSEVEIFDRFVVKRYLLQEDDQELIDNEVSILKELQDSKITPKLLSSNPRELCLERCKYGSLRYIISDNITLITEVRAERWINQCEGILKHLHSINIVHGDFTSFNILVDEHYDVKVCDFMTSGEGFINNCAIRWREDCHQEINNERHDTFALGIVVWELVMLKGPYFWASDSQVRDMLNSGIRLYCKEHKLKSKYIQYVS